MKTRIDGPSHFSRLRVVGDINDPGNGVDISAAATSGAPAITAVGDDTNVDLTLAAKGTGRVKSTSGIGYGTGAGGTVTQATSKSTGVTLSKLTGQITLNNAALAAATIVSFALTNTLIEAGDLLVLNHVSGGTPGAYSLNGRCGAGTATIDVRNNTAGSLGEAIVIGFAVIKGATA